MRNTLIIILIVLNISSSQLDFGSFKDQFLLEIEKFKPNLTDKNLEKMITKIAKTYFVEERHTNKVVDLNHILANCGLDFETKLVKSSTLPASAHLINHIIKGGLIRPGQQPVRTKNDLWMAYVGVVLKKDSQHVYSLLFDLRVHFEKSTFIQKSGLYLKDIDERVLVNSIFYNKCLEIAERVMSPIIFKPEPIKEN